MSFSIAVKGIKKTADSIKKRNDIAAFRTMNILEKRAKKAVGKEIRDIYPVKQRNITNAIRVSKATYDHPVVLWSVRSGRFNLPKAKQTKKGVTYTGLGKKRKSLNEHHRGGSKPFMIRGQYSDRMVPVYRKAGVKTYSYAKDGVYIKNTVTTLRGHSIPWLFKFVKWEDIIKKLFRDTYGVEYKKQLDRAKF